MPLTPVRFVLALLLTATTITPAVAQARLVVFLSIDQFRSDYIEQYGRRWTGGLRRLVDGGARFVQGRYPYLNTVTCAGHATMATGTFPSTHGMVLNAWWDRRAARDVACTEDANTSAIGYNWPDGKSGGQSAHRLLAHTFADELRGQSARAPRIVSLSMKARSAIMLAGRRGDAVLWFEPATGLTTSTAFTAAPTTFVQAFVKSNPIEAELATPWARLLPDSAYLHEDDALGEQPPTGWTRTFPHPLAVDAKEQRSPGALWAVSPLADAYLARLATTAVGTLQLGQQDGTDYLAISFSVLDGVGHTFGPRSHEVQDVLFRLDRTLGELLDVLDRRVGRDHYVVALTADHGVSPVPEQAAALGLDAGRVDLKTTAARLQGAIAGRLGPGDYVSRVAYTDLYLAPGVFDRLRADEAAMREAMHTLSLVPGIAQVLRSDRLAEGAAAGDPVARAAYLGHHAERSGDLLIVPKPYWLMSSAAATHGTYYTYDQRVPVLLYGAQIKPGTYWQDASPADLAPTLAAICGITMARTDGRVLSEALLTPPPRPASSARDLRD